MIRENYQITSRVVEGGGRRSKRNGLNHRVASYLKYRETIEEIRMNDNEDELGWCEYIHKSCLESRLTKGGKRKGLLLRNGYSSMAIPTDGLEAV